MQNVMPNFSVMIISSLATKPLAFFTFHFFPLFRTDFDSNFICMILIASMLEIPMNRIFLLSDRLVDLISILINCHVWNGKDLV